MINLSTQEIARRSLHIKCRWMEFSPPTTGSFYLLPPPPAFRHPLPRAWKRRGGMIIISTRECTRRCVYIKCRWMELSPPNTEIPYRNSYLNSLVKSYRRGRFATAPSMEFLLTGADALRPFHTEFKKFKRLAVEGDTRNQMRIVVTVCSCNHPNT